MTFINFIPTANNKLSERTVVIRRSAHYIMAS